MQQYVRQIDPQLIKEIMEDSHAEVLKVAKARDESIDKLWEVQKQIVSGLKGRTVENIDKVEICYLASTKEFHVKYITETKPGFFSRLSQAWCILRG